MRDNLFNSFVSKQDKVEKLAFDLGFDQDDFANETPEDLIQQVVSAKEYVRMNQEINSKPNNWATEQNAISNASEVVYRLIGRDEYRLKFRESKGTNILEENAYQLNDLLTPEVLFKGNDFAMKQMPKIYESETGDIWVLEPKNIGA